MLITGIMKSLQSYFTILFSLLLLQASLLHAQSTKPILRERPVDSPCTHVVEISLAPGEKTKAETTLPHFFYAVTDCSLKVYVKDGQPAVFELKAGECSSILTGTPYITENTGSNTIDLLFVEGDPEQSCSRREN